MMITPAQQQQYRRAAEQRLLDAEALLSAEPVRGTGAVYLAGYALEVMLKLAVARLAAPSTTPAAQRLVWRSHDLGAMLAFAAHLDVRLERLARLESRPDYPVLLRRTVGSWRVGLRYDPTALDPADATGFVQDVRLLMDVMH